MLQLVLGAVCISFSAVFVKLAPVAPMVSAFYRVLFGGLALCAALVLSGGLGRLRPGLIVGALVCGAFFAGDLWSWHASILRIGPGQATMLANFQVFLITFAAAVLYRQKPGPIFLAALVLAMLGLYGMVGAGWEAKTGEYKTGVFFGLLSAVFYTGYLLRLKTLASGQAGPLAVMAAVSLGTAVLLGAATAAVGESFVLPDGRGLAVLAAYGVICQGLGWFLISTGLARTRAALAGLILLLQPALSYVWDLLFFAKPVTPVEACGAALALTAIYLGSTRGAGPRQGKTRLPLPDERPT